MSNNFIKLFKIDIGSEAIGGIPFGDPFITIWINDRYTMLKLEDLKNWLNLMWESKGDRNEKALHAAKQFRGFIAEILAPFMDFDAMHPNPDRPKDISLNKDR